MKKNDNNNINIQTLSVWFPDGGGPWYGYNMISIEIIII